MRLRASVHPMCRCRRLRRKSGGRCKWHARLTVVVPAKALRHAHIFESPSYCDSADVFEPMFESDWSRWFGGWVAVPTTEATDDPGGPSEGLRRVRVFEPCALGLEVSIESSESCDLVFIEG